MGLFSGSKEVIVSSVIYNLAGAEADRPDFLKTTVASGILHPNSANQSLGDTIVNAQFKGPAVNQRHLYQWSKKHFPIGSPTAEIIGGASTLGFDFTPYITVPAGSTAEVVSSYIESADFFYWAEQFLMENNPTALVTNWTADIDNTNSIIQIQYEGGTTQDIPATGYDRDADYIYVRYTLVTPQYDEFGTPLEDLREPRLYIYQIGSGTPELDALVSAEGAAAEFYPFIPLRLWNQSIRDTEYTTTQPIFADCKKAYRKATGQMANLNKLLDQIEDNPDVGDIDFCFLVYGVPLNTKDNDSRRYIYEFFRRLMPYQTWSLIDYNDWLARRDADPQWVVEHPPVTTIHLKSSSSITSAYDVKISWGLIDETTHVGLAKPDAKRGDVWIEKQPPITFNEIAYITQGSEGEPDFVKYTPHEVDVISVIHQVTANSYRRLEIRGLLHQNQVYSSYSVRTTGTAALDDLDESGFVVPMHYPTVQRLNLVGVNQIAMGNGILVFNCYKIVKQKWYQSGFFKVLIQLVVVIITAVLTYFTGPGGAMAGGILGANLAIGASLGLTGLSAFIVGAIANAIAAMVLTMIISELATMMFGDKLGALIGVLASFVALTAIANFQMTGSWALNWGDMMKAENLLKITDVGARAAQGYTQGRMTEIQDDLTNLAGDYESQLEEIEKRTAELLGYSGAFLNPLMFLQDSASAHAESSNTFLTRTLLTGSDIAEVSLDMIHDFSRLTLELPDYTT